MNPLSKLPFLALLILALILSSGADAKKNGKCARKSSLAPAQSSSPSLSLSLSPSSSSSSGPGPASDSAAPSHMHYTKHASSSAAAPTASSSSVDSSAKPAPSSHKSFVAHSSAPASSSSSSSSSPPASSPTGSSSSSSSLIPNGVKAGVAGGDALPWLASHLGWYYDWSPTPNNTKADNIQRIPMLWGLGKTSDPKDEPRFQQFKQLPKPAAKYVAGFNEPDFSGSGSSGFIDPKAAAAAWDAYLAPHGRAGAKLISPSCAKQADETWMKPFLAAVQYQPDIIAVHIFVNNTDLLKNDLNHYAQYGKPMMITEFACIDYQGQTKYCDQGRTNALIQAAVPIFENDDRVIGYALSDAYNGPHAYLTTAYTGARVASLTTTGSVYLSLISKANNSKRNIIRAVRGFGRHARSLRRRRGVLPRA